MAETDVDLITLTADIVGAHVAHNNVPTGELAGLIQSVHSALKGLGETPEPVAEKQEPAVSIRSSVKPDHIVCLEDGKKLKMLKRYLRTNYDMSPDEYRRKWNLPSDYPMVAPNYAEKRRTLAHSIGLGRKTNDPAASSETLVELDTADEADVAEDASSVDTGAEDTPETEVETPKAKRTRKPKAKPAVDDAGPEEKAGDVAEEKPKRGRKPKTAAA